VLIFFTASAEERCEEAGREVAAAESIAALTERAGEGINIHRTKTKGGSMKYRLFAAIFAIALFFSAFGPTAALADFQNLIVEPNPAAGSGNFGSIQAAINQAQFLINANPALNNNLRILVSPGTYSENTITPISYVPIIGGTLSGTTLTTNTANTIISGSTTVMNLTGVTNVTISNFTFQSGATMTVSNSTSVTLTNIIFNLNGSGTALRVANSATTSVINNTFFNGTSAISTDSDILITNNIFDHNSTTIATSISLTRLSYNAFYHGVEGVANNDPNHTLPNTLHPGLDPLFVNPPNDFHLQATSPCVGNGNTSYPNSFNSSSDMGAFGGPSSDLPPPATVTGVTSTLTAPSTITVSWSPTSNSTVTGYRVYYGTISNASSGFSGYNGTQAAEGNSPIGVSAGTTSQTLSGLPTTTTPPAAPVLTSLVPLDQALQVNWTAAARATSYLIYFSTTTFDDNTLPANPVTADGGTTTKTLTGLQNGTPYFVAVKAVAANKFFISVTAVIDTTKASNPGSANESAFSVETSQDLGGSTSSPLSSLLKEYPEAVSPFPDLKSGGCFIATAAYGFYSAPQVQALRVFRDRYLLTNAPGRAFVAWYYRYGPIGARFITQHPWLKPPVRLALFPLVVMALFLIHTSPLAKTALIMIAVVVTVYLYQRNHRKMLVQSGGIR